MSKKDLNTVRVYYDAENTEKTQEEKRFLPIVLEYGGFTATWLPKGPLFKEVDKKTVVKGADGISMTIFNKHWNWLPQAYGKNQGPYFVDVPVGAWKAWNSVGKWSRLLRQHGRVVLVTEMDMFKRSHADIEDANAKIAEKMATIARLQEEEKTLLDRASKMSASSLPRQE